MNILQICPRQFWPADTGAKLRNEALARQLAAFGAVSLLAFEEQSSEHAPPEDIAAWLKSWQTVHRAPRPILNMVRSLKGAYPATVLNYTAQAMAVALKSELLKNRFDAVQIESIHLASYIEVIKKILPSTKIIMDWHNIESELMARYADSETNFFRAKAARFTAKKLVHTEITSLRSTDLLLLTSERELERVQTAPWNASCPIAVIENGVDSHRFRQIGPQSLQTESTETQQLIFVGSLDYHANIDAVKWFAIAAWPQIYDRHPKMIFRIVGRRPTAEILELSKIAGIDVVGEVDDVRPFYEGAVASIVPLRVGGGTRLKILEAMAARVPVISTSLGAEGLSTTSDIDIMIADTPVQLSDAISRLVANPNLGSQISENAYRMVQERYDWRAVGRSLKKAYVRIGLAGE
jgi:glycosyltransferase involved in cell wall biosynthesis